MQPKKRPKIFLDANVVIQAGKPPGGPILARVKDLVDAGFITVLTTDLSCKEVAKRHAENDYKVIKNVGLQHFRQRVRQLLGTELPEVSKGELKARLIEGYDASTTAMFDALGAKTLEIDDIKPSIVFSDYAAGQGFFTGEAKKDQFPDAFIFECLKAEASEEEPIIIVSNDKDFIGPVEAATDISLVTSLPELFRTLGFQVDAPEVDEFLESRKDELVEMVNRELGDWGLIGDVEDSEIDATSVTDAEVVELLSFGSTEQGGLILVVARLSVEAYICFTHPDWDNAVYDSEDKCLFPLDNVDGEAEISFNVDVSMSISVDEDDKPEAIEELRFQNGDFWYVELYPPYDIYD